MLTHGDIPICRNLVCLCQWAKTILPDSNSWWKYNFDIEVKSQGHIEITNVCDTLYHPLMVIDACAKYGKPMSIQKMFFPEQRAHFNQTWHRTALGQMKDRALLQGRSPWKSTLEGHLMHGKKFLNLSGFIKIHHKTKVISKLFKACIYLNFWVGVGSTKMVCKSTSFMKTYLVHLSTFCKSVSYLCPWIYLSFLSVCKTK